MAFVLLQDGSRLLLQDGSSVLLQGDAVVIPASYRLGDLEKQVNFYSTDGGVTWYPQLSPAGPPSIGVVEVATATTTLSTPPSELRVRLKSVRLVASPANSGAVVYSLKLGSATAFTSALSAGQSFSWDGCREGAVNGALSIEFVSGTGTIYVNADVDHF